MTKRFTCVSIGFGNLPRINERLADSADKAADAHVAGINSAYWAEPWRTGADRHGSYSEFTVKAGSKIHSTVRVYEDYK